MRLVAIIAVIGIVDPAAAVEKCTSFPPPGFVTTNDLVNRPLPSPRLDDCHPINAFGDNHAVEIELCEQHWDETVPATTKLYCLGDSGWREVEVPTIDLLGR